MFILHTAQLYMHMYIFSRVDLSLILDKQWNYYNLLTFPSGLLTKGKGKVIYEYHMTIELNQLMFFHFSDI